MFNEMVTDGLTKALTPRNSVTSLICWDLQTMDSRRTIDWLNLNIAVSRGSVGML